MTLVVPKRIWLVAAFPVKVVPARVVVAAMDPGAINVDGIDKVTFPVAADAVISLEVPAIDRTGDVEDVAMMSPFQSKLFEVSTDNGKLPMPAWLRHSIASVLARRTTPAVAGLAVTDVKYLAKRPKLDPKLRSAVRGAVPPESW